MRASTVCATLSLLGSKTMMSHSRDAADTAGNVVGQLGHEEDVAVAHDRDGAVPQRWIMVANDGRRLYA